MYKLDEFKQLVKDFSGVADFLVVYIAEAHSTDGWAFTNNVAIKLHKNLEERISAAKILLKEDPLCPIVVDDMTNITSTKYGAMPERLYVLQAGKVVFKVRCHTLHRNPTNMAEVTGGSHSTTCREIAWFASSGCVGPCTV
uniref:Iodothyronine deiodinase n=1 Tax=Gouania willdenowi TaxID=441366 RepID=A0A8C5D611_GOUWI